MNQKKRMNRELNRIRKSIITKKWLILLLLGLSAVNLAPLFTIQPGLAATPAWPANWTLITTDPDDGVIDPRTEILLVEFTEDSNHYYIRITTEADVGTDCSLGVLVNDGASDGLYDVAIGCGYDQGYSSWAGLAWYWNTGTSLWNVVMDTYNVRHTHVRMNYGAFHGMEVAVDKSPMPFVIDPATDYFKAVSLNGTTGGFGFGRSEWNSDRDPSTVDDYTSPTTFDAVAPSISSVSHSPSSPTDQDAITISATVTDDTAVQAVTLYYSTDSGNLWQSAAMSGSPYDATIGPFTPSSVWYYIEASDTNGNIVHNPVGAPASYHSFNVTGPPLLIPLTNITYQEGLTGHWLNWTVTDDDPTTYAIYRDSSPVVQDASWSSGEAINYSVDGLTVGTYNFTITVQDTSGYASSDTVFVTVLLAEYLIIDGDADFAAKASSEGWSGDGSSSTPYIIENYMLELGGNVPGISISNTAVHFILRDNYVGNYSAGYHFKSVTNGQVIGNTAVNNSVGFLIDDCTYPVFAGNTAMNSSSNGFEVYLSRSCTFTDNNMTENGGSGIYIENSIDTITELNNLSRNGEHGVHVTSFADPAVYTGNDVISNYAFNNVMQGIYLRETTNTVRLNVVEDNNLNGILLAGCDGCELFDNEILDNQLYGISVDSTSSSNTIYSNGFYRNNGGGIQGRDDGTGNTWYDEVADKGNLWDDWSGSGTYLIAGGAVNYDIYPMPFIALNGPNDFSMEYGSTIYSISWTISIVCPGNKPDNYTVYRDDSIIEFGSSALGNWTNTVIISLTGLDLGLHNFTIEVFNNLGMKKIHTVWVTVSPDIIDPVIITPGDLSFEEGSLGYSLTWSGSDSNPWRAVVKQNSLVIYNKTWIGENVTVDLDSLDLTAGTYDFTCTLYDWTGNWISDTVQVTVEPRVPDTTPPSITAPDPLEYVLGTTDHVLVWVASDDHPMAYQWFLNDTDMGYYPWRGDNITTPVAHLPVGLWIVNVTVFDLSGNNVTVTTTVTVIPIPPDYDPPAISQPAALEIYENNPGSIIWEVSDVYPSTYVIYQGSTIVKQGYWTTGIIQYSFIGLAVGTWEFNLTVWDESGNWNSAKVTVTVLPGSGTEIISPVIAEVPDMTVQYGTIGNNVTFRVFDEHPGYIEVFLNGTRICYSPWFEPNQKVIISLDSWEIGTYNLTFVARDFFGNIAVQSITIRVTGDTTPPVLSSPGSIRTSADQSATISWTASDDNLASYEIILVETSEQLEAGSISGQTTTTFSFTISGFEEGEYTVRLIVYDTFGHRTMDDVHVVVEPAKAQPASGFELMTLLSIFFACTIFRRIRKNSSKKNPQELNL